MSQEIPKKLIEEILEAGRFAPSGLNKQPWEFIVITNKKLIKELSLAITKTIKSLYIISPILKLISKQLRDERTFSAIRKTATSGHDTVFYNAPLVIFIVSNKQSKWVRTDCALAAQNMMLATHSLGIGSCFIGRGFLLSKNRRLLKKIGLRHGYKIYAVLVFGYPKEFPKSAPERRKDNVVCWKE